MNIQAWQTGSVPLFVRVRAGEAKDGLKSTRDQLDFAPSPISSAPSACTPMRIWLKFVAFEAHMSVPAWHSVFMPLLVRVRSIEAEDRPEWRSRKGKVDRRLGLRLSGRAHRCDSAWYSRQLTWLRKGEQQDFR